MTIVPEAQSGWGCCLQLKKHNLLFLLKDFPEAKLWTVVLGSFCVLFQIPLLHLLLPLLFPLPMLAKNLSVTSPMSMLKDHK